MSYQSAQVDCPEQTTFVHDTSPKKSMWKIAGALAGAMCVGTVLLASGSQEKVVAASDNIDTLFSAAVTASPIMTKASLATRRAQFAQGRSMRSHAMAPRPRAVTKRAVTMMAHGHDSRKFFVGGNWKWYGIRWARVNVFLTCIPFFQLLYVFPHLLVCPQTLSQCALSQQWMRSRCRRTCVHAQRGKGFG